MAHITVYSESDTYAGWPANHGHWQWGDEFLVGFMRGPYAKGGMHAIDKPFQKMLARSLDGGVTWVTETPNIDFSAAVVYNAATKLCLSNDIIRVCGVYDTGGEDCSPHGGFYISQNKGHGWFGPYVFNGLESVYTDDTINTSRTAVLGNHVFLSLADPNFWGSDATFCARWDGEKFQGVSQVCNDAYRAVMPAVAKVGDDIFVALRRRDRSSGCWIDLYRSTNECVTWEYRSRISETGAHNGNPPALIAVRDKLVCAYANRSTKTINAATSVDQGLTWDTTVLRHGTESDIGYPRLFLRIDGKVVCVYYWSDAGEPQHIEATIFEV